MFKYSIYPKNVGKAVAREVSIGVSSVDGEASFAESKAMIRMFQDQHFHLAKNSMPSKTLHLPFPEVIAPGDSSSVPIYAGDIEPEKKGTTFRYSYIVGRIDYRDAFGPKHWKRSCFMLANANGELGNCKYGNDEDSNRESASLPK